MLLEVLSRYAIESTIWRDAGKEESACKTLPIKGFGVVVK